MNSKFIVIFSLVISTFSFKLRAQDPKENEEKTVLVVVENTNGKAPSKDIDVFLASTLGGLTTIQKAIKDAGKYNCNCNQGEGNTYVSFGIGNGQASEGGSLAWKAFSLRLGKSLSKDVRVDFIHLNEGHPVNQHRDGFALQGTYELPVTKKLTVEASVGPYFSMNTTTVNGVELDDKRLGLLGTIAALYSLDNISPGLHIRAEYNHVIMPGAMKTDSIMVGVGKAFNTKNLKSANGENNIEVAVIGDHFITNHGDVDESPRGFQLEVKKEVTEHTAASVSYMHEGKDSRVDRQGVAAEYWYVQPLNANWTASTGAGVYLANNKLDNTNQIANGIISIEFKRAIGKNASVFIRVNRIADFGGSNDRDVIGVGIAGKY